MKRVMLVLPNGDLGGGQETVRLLAKHLDQARYAVTVVCPPSPTLERIARMPGVRGIPMRFPTLPSVRVIRQLATLIETERVDILHTHLFHGDLYGFFATRLARVPVLVSTIQGVNFDWRAEAHPRRARWWVASHGYRAIYRAFDRIATCSAAVRDAVCTRPGVKLRRDRLRVIHNSVDVDELRKTASDLAPGEASRSRRLLTVANFAPFKGHRVLLEAMAKLPPALGVESWLVGDGPERPAMERLARDLGIAPRVRFLGYRGDVPLLLRQCDAFVLPSLWEPFGIALVEAMVMGVPVVAARAGGVPEIVTDGETGLLAPAGDPEALASKIRLLLEDDALAARLASRGAHEAETRFDARGMAARYEALYEGSAA